MEQKIQSLITETEVNDAVFHGETFQPTLINFFFGKNGSGKTTIGNTLKKPELSQWQAGVNPADLEILVYNEDFIRENIQSYGNIPGVFTITEQDAEAELKIRQLKDQKNTASEERITAKTEEDKAKKADAQAYDKMVANIWEKTRDLTKQYRETQKGFMREKKVFATELLQTAPVSHEKAEMDQLYKTAWGSSIKKYPLLRPLPSTELPDSELLDKRVVNSGDTDFAGFVKALNALSWIQQGHKEFYGKTDGKCPYCQQDLPDTFEEDLASCYDEQYRNDVKALEDFQEKYRNAMNSIYVVLKGNLDTEFETPLLDTYRDKLNLFVEKGKSNTELIKSKIEKPEDPVVIEKLDDILEDLNELISQINEKINDNNAIINDIDTQKENVKKMVWELMAYECQGDIEAYKVLSEGYKEDTTEAQKKQRDLTKEIQEIDAEVKELNNRTTNTTVAMESINRELDYNGFRGFRLREKKGAQYVYELVRDDGSVAQHLSEGERNIIAFLYFYHLVTGSQSDDGQRKDEIVVIDDPVSSMDSGSMSLVASLTRNMIETCYNNQDLPNNKEGNDYIKQFFCLTHNAYFFEEITFNKISDYRSVSFYEVKKDSNNVSTIIPCVEEEETEQGGGKRNYSPVKNYYDGLWDIYKNTDDPTAIINAMKDILEYFFIQMCGYNSDDLREKLSKGKDPEGFSESDYNLANSLLVLLETERRVMSDGVFFDQSQVDVSQCRDVFKRLFKLLGQDQHYRARMGE